MSIENTSFLSSCNARALNPAQVAKTFVPSQQLERLCQLRHSIVVGPRGSGKTTLLKMLQQPALEAWSHVEADRYIADAGFTGVFVATDISWGEQLRSIGSGNLDEETRQLISNASFTTHILRSLVIAMQHRVTRDPPLLRTVGRVELSAESESKLVRALAKGWHIEHIIPTLVGVRQALTGRLAFLREIASQETLQGEIGRVQRLVEHKFLHLHFLQAAAYAIELFDAAVGQSHSKWAFLFDELEIAPQRIQAELVRSIRSVDDRFLFKLALSPFTDRDILPQEPTAPMVDQDFDQISLWYAEKREGLVFCRNLWAEMLKVQGKEQTEPLQVFGKSYFDSYPDEWELNGNAYGPKSRWARVFRSLAHKDRSFRAYLNARGIRPEHLDQTTSNQRASEIRKIAPIVALRDYFIRADDGTSQNLMRSRKRPANVYSGAESVFAITEGYPRRFLGLMRALLGQQWERSTVSAARQGEEMYKTAQRYAAALRTIPVRQKDSGAIGVMHIIRKAGAYFNAQAVRNSFRPEPPGSFIVDSNTDENVLIALSQALNAGAIVYVPDDAAQLILSSLKGKRFRLTYMLAPLYEFPIRLGSSVSLKTILNWTEEGSTDDEQNLLFGSQDDRP